MSPNAAATLLIAAEANTPPMNLVMKMPAAVLLDAVPILNRPKIKAAGNIDHLRPWTSLIGAHIKGPRAKPVISQTRRMLTGI